MNLIPESDRLVLWLREIGVDGVIDRRHLANGDTSYTVRLKWANGRKARLYAVNGWRWLEGEIVKMVCALDQIESPEWSRQQELSQTTT